MFRSRMAACLVPHGPQTKARLEADTCRQQSDSIICIAMNLRINHHRIEGTAVPRYPLYWL